MKKSLLLSALAITTAFVSFGQHRWHIKPTPEEIEYRKAHPRPQPSYAQKTTADFTMPAGARIPGEFEESQAVAIAWIKDYNTNLADVTSDYAHIWAEMTDAIQKECTVWIRIEDPSDSNTIKNYMNSKGTPLTNYKFYLTIGDDFWARDFGPIGFYYGANDDVGMLDMNYYSGRDNDDLFPQFLASQNGFKLIRTNLYAEGGNFITDGFRRSWHSDVIYGENMSGGQPLHGSWGLQQTKDTIKYVWASDEVTPSVGLNCDGGTEHNDMYMKLMDENTFVIMEYPAVVTAPDRAIIENEITTLTSAKTIYGKPFRIFRMPMPTKDNGTYTLSCSDLNNDARTFVNGLTVNKTYLMPSFSSTTSGNQAGDADAIKAFQNVNRGYKIVPIDSRLLTQLGGAIHCITMQIPADNPILFWHPPIVDLQDFAQSFHIVSKITNKSGIAEAKCVWRKQGTTAWNTVTLTDSSGYFIGDITGLAKRLDVVEYYLEAKSNNGKTMQKPITASNGGYYVFYFDLPTTTANTYGTQNFVLNPLPNPTTGNFYIPVSFESKMHISANITDIFGKTIKAVDFGEKSNGMNKLGFDINDLASGMYFVQISANGKLVDTKKIVKQ